MVASKGGCAAAGAINNAINTVKNLLFIVSLTLLATLLAT